MTSARARCDIFGSIRVYNRAMLMKFMLGVIVFGIVAFLVGLMTAPEVGDSNPRIKILAAISVAKEHRDALDAACKRSRLSDKLSLVDLGLQSPAAYAGNFRKRVDVDILSGSEAQVTVHLKALGDSVPADAYVRYSGTCDKARMTWARASSPLDLLPPKAKRAKP